MALNNMGININITVNTAQAQQNAQGVAQALNQVANAGANAANAAGNARQQFANLAGAFVQMTVGKHLVGLFGALAMKADAVTMGMQNIKTVMDTSFGGADEAKLKNQIMSVAETTGKTFTDVATATKNLIAQGLSPDEAGKLIMPLMKFSEIGDIGVQKATDLAVALTNMGIGADHAGNAFDVMVNIANKTSLNVSDFADVMTRVAPTASMVGMSFNELAVTAGFMRKSFSSAREESTALARTMQFLERSKPEEKIRKAFGVEAIDKATGRLRPLLDIIQDVNIAMQNGKGSAHDLFDIFGGKSGAQVFAGGVATLRQGMNFNGQQLAGQDLINAMRATPEQSGGTVDTAFSEKMQALTPQLERLKVAFDDLIGTIGGSFTGSLTKGVEALTDMITGFRTFLNEHPIILSALGFLVDQFGKLAGIIGAFAFVGGGLSILKVALGPVMGLLVRLPSLLGAVGATSTVAAVGIQGLFRALLGPVGLILLALDLLPSIFNFFKKNESNEFGSTINDAALANAKAAESMNKTADALAEATKEFNSIVAMYTGAAVKKFPVLDPRSEGVLNAILNTVGETAKVPEAGLAPMRTAFHDAFMEARTKGNISNDTMNAATVAAQQAIFYAQRNAALGVPGADKQAKQIEDFLKQLEIMASPQMVLGTKRDRMVQHGMDITHPEGGLADPFTGLGPNDPEALALQNMLAGRGRRFGPMEPTMEQRKDQAQKSLDFSIVEAMKKTPATFTINSPVELRIGNEGSIAGMLRTINQHESNVGMVSQ